MHEQTATVAHRVYEFGPFRVDLPNRLLHRDGQPVRLSGKVFDLLVFFVANSGRLLTKDEILQAVWPDSVVEEGNLARHVSTLRKVLQDGPRDHGFIVTVSGRGYRFDADVSIEAPAASAGFVEPPPIRAVEPLISTVEPPISILPTARAAWLWLAVGACGVLVIVLAAWMVTRPTASASPALALESRTTTGDVYAPAISRDGAYIAYAWLAPGGGEGLRIRSTAGGNPIDLIPASGAQYWAIRFSARGEYIYYVAGDRGVNPSGTLFRVATAGGAPERLVERAVTVAPSPDGRMLAFVRGGTAPEPTRLMLASATGGDPRTLMTLDPPGVVQSLDWASDSRVLLYVVKRREPAGDDRWHVGEIAIAGGDPTVVLPARSTGIIAVASLPNRRGFLMNAVDPESGLPQLWRVSYRDGSQVKLTDDGRVYKDLTITADGTRIVVQSLAHFAQVWVARDGDFHHARQIASGTFRGAYDDLAWMPGDRLLFRWAEHGSYDIWSMAADGTDRRALTTRARDVSGIAMDPSARYIFFASNRSGSWQIWRMRADGDDLRQLTHLRSGNAVPVASPDGRWIYFMADGRGVPTLWRMTIDGASLTEVIDRPIAGVDLSPDGTQLVYSYRDPVTSQIKVAVASIDGKQLAHSFDIEPTYMLGWTPDGTGVAFTRPEGNVWIQPLAGGAPYPLTDQHPGFHTVAFAWSPGGRYFAYTVLADPVDAMTFKIQP
jgi:Tol biopolymer transport system component/DNA-binding winged helix-turn-helix (wHTH) protein